MKLPVIISTLLTLAPLTAGAYPLDGMEYTGIERLEGYRLAQTGEARARQLPDGALLNLGQVAPRLWRDKNLQIPPVDKAFSEKVRKLLRSPSYGIAVLDLTDRKYPLYAEHNAGRPFNPGSVGKLMVAMAIFNSLKKFHPRDIKAREKVLKEALVTADNFIITDSHKVPFWQQDQKRIYKRRLQRGDTASLWTYLDWMLSPSSNAAASMVLKQLISLEYFGEGYPASKEEEKALFRSSPSELGAILRQALDDGVRASGLDPQLLRQGGFFTSGGKQRVPGGGSTATPRELLKFLFNLEKGLVIDPFSSREIKRLIYMTERRIRYASSPALNDAAVYFKSGSLYRCRPEPRFTCGKYRGNDTNLLNSVAIVESPAGDNKGLFYMAVVTSNVLKHNAAVDHQTLATRLHRLIQQRHQPLSQPAEADQKK